jgi:hypothetical protein
MLKLLLTNWIHLLGFYIVIEISIIIHLITSGNPDTSLQATILIILLAVPFLMISYGLMFIVGFLFGITLLDVILFSLIKYNRWIFVIEWLLIVPVFIYWAFEHEYWLWLYLSAAFLVTQVIRSQRIKNLSIEI